MVEEYRKREAIALTKNKLYKTYQFHGIVGKGKNPELVFKHAIAQIFIWMREKFRNFEEIPEQLLLPNNENLITDNMLKSFTVEDGYTIETVFIKEEGVWSFKLTEPDMGSGERLPAPGRLFITNLGLRKTENQIEFGCMLICAQPEIIEQDAEVFRPKVVRDLIDNLGLYSLCDLKYEAFNLAKPDNKKLLKGLLESTDRQMPVVVLENKQSVNPEGLKMEDIVGNIITGKNLVGHIEKFRLPIEIDSHIKHKQGNSNVNTYIDASDKLAKKLAGFAYVFFDTNAKAERSCIYFEDIQCKENDRDDIAEKVMSYPKRNERFKFGQVLFFSEAQELKQNLDMEKLSKSDDYVAENKGLNDKIQSLKKQITEEKQHINDLAETSKKEKIQSDSLINQFRIAKNILERENEDLKKALMAKQYELADSSERLNTLESKAKRPEDIPQFIKWVESYYCDDIFLMTKAKEGLKHAKNIQMKILCDAIEVLSNDYKRWRLKEIDDEEYIRGCKSRTDSSFEIGGCGSQNINRYAKEYKVYYNTDTKDKRFRKSLDLHIKCGVDNKFLTRIYFFWDDECSKIIIGSMPDHLPTITGY